MTTIDKFGEFFAAFQDGMTDADHGRIYHQSRRDTARDLYDHLVQALDDGADLRTELYRHTCRLCGEWKFGAEYQRAAITLYVAEMRARSPVGVVDEAEAGRVLLEFHDCREYSDYRPGDPIDPNGFIARAVLDPEPLLWVIRVGAEESAPKPAADGVITPAEIEEAKAEIQRQYNELNERFDAGQVDSQLMRRIIDGQVRLYGLVAGVRLGSAADGVLAGISDDDRPTEERPRAMYERMTFVTSVSPLPTSDDHSEGYFRRVGLPKPDGDGS